jgi:hypothetical protein
MMLRKFKQLHKSKGLIAGQGARPSFPFIFGFSSPFICRYCLSWIGLMYTRKIAVVKLHQTLMGHMLGKIFNFIWPEA